MADNTAQNGTSTVATDDIGGVHYQRVKATFGADGVATDVSAADPLPIAGNVASGVVDAGAPVKIGARYRTIGSRASVGHLERTDIAVDSVGSVLVSLMQAESNTQLSNGNGVFVQGNVAAGAADAGSPVKAGGVFNTTQPTLATGQRGDLQLDVNGNLRTVPQVDANATFRGRGATYRTIGRAGTTPRRLLAIWNAAGSGKVVHVNQITCDILQTAVMAVTVVPPVLRVHRITAIPTNGTALTKVAKDTAGTSSASISLFGDASADGTNSATALAATVTAGAHLTQEFLPRLITAAGYEMFDRVELLEDRDIVLRPGEGIVLSLDGITAATQEPATTHTISTVDWYETN